MAAAWSAVPVKEYAAYFDTVYISLYKYLGASGGAVLCGSREVIERMPHLIKIHGGNMYGNWANAAMAVWRLQGMEQRLLDAKKKSEEIFGELNQQKEFHFSLLNGGTNIFQLELAAGIDGRKFQQTLNKDFGIRLPFPPGKNKTMIAVNETLLYREKDYIINAFLQSVKAGKG